MAAAKTRERRRIWETWDGCHGRVKIEISPCHCGWKPETLFLTLGCVGTERFLFLCNRSWATGPLASSSGGEYQGAEIDPPPPSACKLKQVTDDFDHMTQAQVRRAHSRKSKPFNVLPSRKWVSDKRRPLFGVILSAEAPHGQMTPLFFFITSRQSAPCPHPWAKVLSQAKVSKSIPHARNICDSPVPKGRTCMFSNSSVV